MKNKHYKLLSFFVPFIIVLIAFVTLDMYLGDNNFLTCDLRYQYLSLFCKLKDILSSNSSIFYSFSKSLGGGMISSYAYYLGSPLNLLIALFSKENITYAIEIMYFIKIGLCGLFMYTYLSKHFKKDGVIILLASLCYSLMAYNINYYWNIMWLDCIYFAPLIGLGIDNLIHKKKIKLYIICLFLAILSNYYIGFMLCIFSVIYFIYMLINTYKLKENKIEIKKDIITFIISSIVVGLMACLILVPTMIELQETAKQLGSGMLEPLKIVYNPFDIISKLLLGSNNVSNMINPKTVNIYCGLITIPLTLLYFFNKKIPKKERISSLVIIVIFLLSFTISYLNMIWHGFTFPAFLNYRYSFLYSLFIIILSVKSILNINKISIKTCLIFGGIWTIISGAIWFLNYSYLPKENIIISLIFMIAYIIFLYFYSHKKTKVVKIILAALLVFELFLNITQSLNDYGEKTSYNISQYYLDTINNKMTELVPMKNDFYRIETDFNFTFMDSMALNYNGMTVFLSTIEDNIIWFLSKCGYASGLNHALYSSGSTKLIDSILSIRYNLETKDIIDEPNKYEVIYNTNRNSDYLPLGFMIDTHNKRYRDIYGSPFEYQDMLFKYLYKSELDYLIPYDTERINHNEYIINISNNYDFYMYFNINDDFFSYEVYLDDEYMGNIDYENKQINVKNKYDKDVKLNLIPNSDYNYEADIYIYYLNYDNFREGINNLRQNIFNIEKFEDDHIKGNIEVKSDKKTLWTSIPYNEGWKILVDGKETKYKETWGTFISIDLEEGYHEIEFIFETRGLKLGIIIFILGVLGFVIVDKVVKKSYSINI